MWCVYIPLLYYYGLWVLTVVDERRTGGEVRRLAGAFQSGVAGRCGGSRITGSRGQVMIVSKGWSPRRHDGCDAEIRGLVASLSLRRRHLDCCASDDNGN